MIWITPIALALFAGAVHAGDVPDAMQQEAFARYGYAVMTIRAACLLEAPTSG